MQKWKIFPQLQVRLKTPLDLRQVFSQTELKRKNQLKDEKIIYSHSSWNYEAR